jgi:hypothetical protein
VLVAGAGGVLVSAGANRRSRGFALLAVLFAVCLTVQLQLNARLQNDGFYYFAYLRSLAFDHDINFANDYRMLGLGDKAHLFAPTPTGHAQSAWTIGPAIVWSPFFAAGHLVAEWLGAHSSNVSTDGTSFPYTQAVCVAGLIYGLLGAWFCYRLTCRFYRARLAVMATTLVFMGSFMLWYMVKEPSMSHAPSMAAVAGFTWAWLATRPSARSGQARSMREWALLGALAGFMTLIRLQNALFAILPACEVLAVLWASARAGDQLTLTRATAAGLLFTACATIAFAPQMIAWKAIYGSYFAVSLIGPQFDWANPHIADVLWSSRNGLLSTSPILYAGAIGFVIFAFAQPSIGIPVLLAAALMTYVNASIRDWWGGDGFGMRRFDGLIPMMTIGLAALSVRLVSFVRRFPTASGIGVFGTLVAWNLTLMSAAHDGRVRLGEAVSFGDIGAAQARAVHRWIGMPSTYPASLLFAWQGDVSPADYDLLAPNRMLDDPRRPYGRIDVGTADDSLVEQGWYVAERDGPDTFRWASAKASLRVPLDHAASLKVQVRLRGFTYNGAPPQQAAISINGRRGPAVTIGPAWQVIEFVTDERAWHAGVNRLALDFAWEARPAEVGAGGDTRPLAGAVDYVKIEVIGGSR